MKRSEGPVVFESMAKAVFGKLLEVWSMTKILCMRRQYRSAPYRLFLTMLLRQEMELGKCGRSLRSLASPVLRAFGALSSDILLYPMLGLSC